ncbi:MAG: hypothetical protein Q4P84_05810, partial [Elusimicrobiales bacterium]|nr:hypothetical protein [Elusimicrobiales bacterium]
SSYPPAPARDYLYPREILVPARRRGRIQSPHAANEEVRTVIREGMAKILGRGVLDAAENPGIAMAILLSRAFDADDACTVRWCVMPTALGLLVAPPTKRCQVIQIKAKLREILQRLDVVHLRRRSKSFLPETVLAKIVIALERDGPDFAPRSALIKTTFFQGIFFRGFVVHKPTNHARGHRFSVGETSKNKKWPDIGSRLRLSISGHLGH